MQFRITSFFVFIGAFVFAQNVEFKALYNEKYDPLNNPTIVSASFAWSSVRQYVPSFGYDIPSFGGQTMDAMGLTEYQVDFLNENFGDMTCRPLGGYGITDRNYDSNLSNEENERRPGLSHVGYQIFGTQGNRILKIEWGNVNFNSGTIADSLNFQVWIYEQSEMVEFHYGPSSVEQPSKYSEINISLYEEDDEASLYTYSLNGNPNAPTFNDDLDGEISSIPEEGTVYQFVLNDTSTSIFNNEYGKIKVHPNPSKDIFSIDFGSSVGRTSVMLYNVVGEKLLQKSTMNEVMDLDLSTFEKGNYLLYMNNNKYSSTKRITVQ
jgi:hypothetical protein